jgi:hypothetical protein
VLLTRNVFYTSVTSGNFKTLRNRKKKKIEPMLNNIVFFNEGNKNNKHCIKTLSYFSARGTYAFYLSFFGMLLNSAI